MFFTAPCAKPGHTYLGRIGDIETSSRGQPRLMGDAGWTRAFSFVVVIVSGSMFLAQL